MEMGMLTRRRGSCLSSAGVCAVGGVAHRTAPCQTLRQPLFVCSELVHVLGPLQTQPPVLVCEML